MRGTSWGASRRASGASPRFRAPWARPREGRRFRLLRGGPLEAPWRGGRARCAVCHLPGGRLRQLFYRFRAWGDPYAPDVPTGGLVHYHCATEPAEPLERLIPRSWGTSPAEFLGALGAW